MDRRTLLAALAATTTSEPLSRLVDGLVSPKVPGQVGTSELEAVRESVAFYSALDLQYGGQVAVGVAGASLKWAVELLERPMADRTRSQLSSAVAALSDRLAWSYHDAGWSYQTRRMSELSIRTSHEGRDPTLAAHIRLNLSSFLEHKPNDAASVLVDVHGNEQVHPLERANVAAVRARHLGNAGRPTEAKELLGLAEDLISKDRPASPSWANFLTEPHLCRVLGRSYHSIGDLPRAADLFERALKGFNPERARGRGQTMARLGSVYLDQGRIDEARRLATTAATTLANVNSHRATSNLTALQQRLSTVP